MPFSESGTSLVLGMLAQLVTELSQLTWVGFGSSSNGQFGHGAHLMTSNPHVFYPSTMFHFSQLQYVSHQEEQGIFLNKNKLAPQPKLKRTLNLGGGVYTQFSFLQHILISVFWSLLTWKLEILIRLDKAHLVIFFCIAIGGNHSFARPL